MYKWKYALNKYTESNIIVAEMRKYYIIVVQLYLSNADVTCKDI